jgi:hypothetical protein
MLNHGHFYHGTVRNSIIVFGKMFSDTYIKRDNANGTDNQFIKVPIAYGPKEKWLVRTEGDPELNRPIEIVLPRMAFEITDFQYDNQRKLHSLNKLAIQDPVTTTKRREQFVPVPYNLTIQLYILSKTQEDALQVVEQILPFFTPQYNVTVNLDPEMGYTYDVPTILNSVSLTDDYDGNFETKRTVIYTLTFTMKTYMFGPIDTSSVITTVETNFIKGPTTDNMGVTSNNTVPMDAYAATVTPSTTPISTDPIPVTQGWTLGDF